MELIIISAPEVIADEATIINRLFETGMSRFHLRKPSWDIKQVSDLLMRIDKSFHGQMALHQYHEMAGYFAIKGLHYKEEERIRTSPEKLIGQKEQGYILSTSAHDLQVLPSLGAFDYAFFGPVFNSISKPGYEGKVLKPFYLDKTGIGQQVIALSGINETNLNKVKEMNFDGAAVLGAIWNNPQQAVANFNNLKTLTKTKPDD
ncbi:thiamine phosphate synthase [Mucilaginibacter dorajii]|uniref:Thiamine phosphate synthase n=1 Tax=Mucilaginibacter dorajii TaxID=692994 RepID=A0ABP7QBK2_9SPHI|nr:thiamine phosphate synthase [Mucilaginibacter dorajii]MCS3733137.1 thiamine-phosphate pyrophosphorylase [Mucilaginibacter dorajii]